MRTLLALALVAGLSGASRVADFPPKHSYVYLWVSDSAMKQSDFIAVIDAQANSPEYGKVVSSLAVGASGMAHHTEAELAPDGHLLANDFPLGRTWLFDLTSATRPAITTSFGDLAGFSHPHSFIRLRDGHVLATYQYLADREPAISTHTAMHDMMGTGRHFTGGLVEMTERGDVIRHRSAASLTPGAKHIYPYSVVALPSIDRAISTTTDMDMADTVATSEWIQIWRLSDLTLLRTVALPPGPLGTENRYTGEPRLLADGRSVYVHTFSCGLYLVTGITGGSPQTPPTASLVHTFPGTECGVPVLTGHYWIQTVPKTHSLVSLDVSDAKHPREVSSVFLGDEESPHWAAIDPTGRRLLVNSGGHGKRLFIVDLDPATGKLALDKRFRDQGDTSAGIEVARRSWPHGFDGPARPHGAVFSR